MDYTNDACRFAFTAGQTVRMQTAIAAHRSHLVSAQNLLVTGCSSGFEPLIVFSPGQLCAGTRSLAMTTAAAGNTFAWSFPGGDAVVVVQSDGDRDLRQPGRVPGDAHRDRWGRTWRRTPPGSTSRPARRSRTAAPTGCSGRARRCRSRPARRSPWPGASRRRRRPRRPRPTPPGNLLFYSDGDARDHEHERGDAQRHRHAVRRQLAQRRRHHPAAGIGDAALPVHDPHVGGRRRSPIPSTTASSTWPSTAAWATSPPDRRTSPSPCPDRRSTCSRR